MSRCKWVCGVLEQKNQSGDFFNLPNDIALLKPLGPDSDADVLVTQLNIAPLPKRSGWEGIILRGVFDGTHHFEATLNTRRYTGDHMHVSVGDTWNAAYRGRDGLVHVLSIEFKVSSASTF